MGDLGLVPATCIAHPSQLWLCLPFTIHSAIISDICTMTYWYGITCACVPTIDVMPVSEILTCLQAIHLLCGKSASVNKAVLGHMHYKVMVKQTCKPTFQL